MTRHQSSAQAGILLLQAMRKRTWLLRANTEHVVLPATIGQRFQLAVLTPGESWYMANDPPAYRYALDALRRVHAKYPRTLFAVIKHGPRLEIARLI